MTFEAVIMKYYLFFGILLLIIGFFGILRSFSLFFGFFTLGIFLIAYTFFSRPEEQKAELPVSKPTRLSFCSQCGTQLESKTLYCPLCGKRLEEEK